MYNDAYTALALPFCTRNYGSACGNHRNWLRALEGERRHSSTKGVNKKPWKRTTVEQKVGDEVREAARDLRRYLHGYDTLLKSNLD